MKKFLAILALLLPLAAHSATVEVGAGVARASVRQDGTWYQDRFQHTIKDKSPAFLVGVTGDFTPNLSWHLDGVYLGKYSVDSQDTPADANYLPTSPTGCNGPCLPMAHYMTSGEVYGITPTLDVHTSGEWRVGLEAGPLWYYRTWSVVVPNWYPTIQTGPSSFIAGQISPINVSDSGWALGSMIGIYVQHERVGVHLNYYSDGAQLNRAGGGWPPIWSGQFVGLITLAF